jgi:hypothetical protein
MFCSWLFHDIYNIRGNVLVYFWNRLGWDGRHELAPNLFSNSFHAMYLLLESYARDDRAVWPIVSLYYQGLGNWLSNPSKYALAKIMSSAGSVEPCIAE